MICSINNSSYLRLQSYKLYDGNTLQLRTPTKQFLHVRLLCYRVQTVNLLETIIRIRAKEDI